jgi:hypothetical protein
MFLLLSILLCLFIILNIKYFADLSEDTDMVNILVVETLISYEDTDMVNISCYASLHHLIEFGM